MTLLDQIDEARRALEELTTDEAQLSRLLAEQTSGIQILKDGGSQDFAQLDSLEGKRTALATLLSDQRSHIVTAAASLIALEIDLVQKYGPPLEAWQAAQRAQ
ncbi:hypothetical protein Q0M94_28010 (plasmid) [Deinococcus radiomollis]|uniref:hypothetical protein n=1 Tax=Deinococcus radiomollis TaxID=468916 RepID=UPI003891D624